MNRNRYRIGSENYNKSFTFRNAGRGIWNVSGSTIPIGTYFGPYNGKLFEPEDYESVKESGYAWEIVDSATKTRVIAFVDPGQDPDEEMDWLSIVNSANLRSELLPFFL